MRIACFGVDTGHDLGFISRKDAGLGFHLLTCFRTPFRIRTVRGIESGIPGDCLLFQPDFPQWHTHAEGAGEGFRNDWIQLSGRDTARLATSLGLPWNTLIRTGRPLTLTEDLLHIRQEMLDRAPRWEAVVQHALRGLFLQVAAQRDRARAQTSAGPARARHYRVVAEVRRAVLEDCARQWTVRSMAKQARLGENRFAVLYKAFFGASPIDELIAARISLARTILLNSDDGLERVALRCGFGSVQYFGRIFHRRVGMTPGAFRR